MDNIRKCDRFKCSTYCSVIDIYKEKRLGILVDLSISGLQIMGEEELGCGPVFNLRIEMSKEVMNSRILVLDAKCLWCKKTEELDFYISGFEFENIDGKTLERIKTFTRSSAFRSSKFCKYALK